MKVGHILYKVANLDAAVRKWRNDGFEVEYGKEKKPYNAVIYFSEGPYLELFHNSGMPSFAKSILGIFGHKPLINRINGWENSEEGLIGLCIETEASNIDRELIILKREKIRWFKSSGGRLDTKGRKLMSVGAFPHLDEIPFINTAFRPCPRPKEGFIHPNGVVSIASISFGTNSYSNLINELCDDPILKIFKGKGVKDLIFKYDE